MQRQELINSIAQQILNLASPPIVRVAIDGVDGAGKTVFADELAQVLAHHKRQIIRSSIDYFHQPRAIRYARGRTSSEGFFYDSYNYATFKNYLLDPLSPTGNRIYRTAAFDHRTDQPVVVESQIADANAILIVDGIFLHRQELRACWDFSLFLQVDFSTTFARMAQRDGSYPDPSDPSNQRYIEGQKLYLREATPQHYATIVIDNTDFANPHVNGNQ